MGAMMRIGPYTRPLRTSGRGPTVAALLEAGGSDTVQTRNPKAWSQAAPLAPPRRGWRRWLILGAAGFVVLATAISLFVFALLKRSEPARLALQRANAHPGVAARIGTPLEVGWVVTGSLKNFGSEGGTVRLSLPVRGPKGRGSIAVRGVRVDGRWTYSVMQLVPDDGSPPVDLRARN
jgi:hypothetical protein